MSVPKGDRREGKLKVLMDARELTVYTQLIMRMDAYLKVLMEAEDGTEETQTDTKREKGVRSSQSGRGKAGGPDRVPCPA